MRIGLDVIILMFITSYWLLAGACFYMMFSDNGTFAVLYTVLNTIAASVALWLYCISRRFVVEAQTALDHAKQLLNMANE